MNTERLRELIKNRLSTDSEDPTLMNIWNDEASILAENVTATIEFFSHECTDDEFSILCEVFDDVIEKTQSKELISVWENRLNNITDETEKALIQTDIDIAKEKIKR